MKEIPQKNAEILVEESLPENKEIGQWELFDIVFDWWNCPSRYPSEVKTFLESDTWINFNVAQNTDPDQLFDVIFEWLNNEYPYKMTEFMACPDGHAKYCDRRGIQ